MERHRMPYFDKLGPYQYRTHKVEALCESGNVASVLPGDAAVPSNAHWVISVDGRSIDAEIPGLSMTPKREFARRWNAM